MNKFEIQVVALDRFTKVFQQVNNSASKALAPLTRTQRQVGVLARTMHLPAIGKGLQTAAQGAAQFASSLGLATGPMAALLSAGALGGVLALAAGVAALTARWAGLGFSLDRTSTQFGLPVNGLQRLQGAAKLAGIPVDEATQAITGLAQALRLVENGDPSASGLRAMLAHLGVDLKKAKDGSVDTMAVLEDLSRAMQRVSNPLTQVALADAAGIGPLLPLLRQGPEAIRKLGDEAERLGLVQGRPALDWAVTFTKSLHGLKGALEGAGNAMGAFTSPALVAAMDHLTWQVSRKDHWSAAAGGTWDFMTAGPRALGVPVNSSREPGLFGKPPEPSRRKVSGVVTDEQGRPVEGARLPPGAESGGSGINLGTAAGQAQLLEDVLTNRDTTYSSDAVRKKMEALVNVIVNIPNAPPGTTVSAQSDSASAPVRVSRSMPAGSLP